MFITYKEKLVWIFSVDLYAIDQYLIRFYAFLTCWRRHGSTLKQDISYLYTSGKIMTLSEEKCCTLFWSDLIYPKKVRLIKLGSKENYIKVHMGK